MHGRLGTVITSDESWLFLDHTPEGKWARSREDVEPRARRTIGSEKVMLVVFWGIRGLILLEALQEGESYDSDYLCDVILPRLSEAVHQTRPRMGLRGLKLHWDNARPHMSIRTRNVLGDAKMEILPHPPYSPDLAPSDFFLFGYIKAKLRGTKFSDRTELLVAVREILLSIETSVLESTFSEWERRLNIVAESDGGYPNY